MNSKIVYQTKRLITNFSQKLGKGLRKSRQKFILDYFYGLSKSKSVILSEIARKLNEDRNLSSTIKRFSRQLQDDSDFNQLRINYADIIKNQAQEDSIVIMDGSTIAKPYSEKLEYLSTIKHPVTNQYVPGYSTMNVSIATPNKKHPIPIYSELYSTKHPDFISENVEIAKAMSSVQEIFQDKNCIFVMDRGFDRNNIMKYILSLEKDFVLRIKKNRNVYHQNRSINVSELSQHFKGKIRFDTTIDKEKVQLKISHCKVQLSAFSDQDFYLLMVYGYGKEPMYILTNRKIENKADVISHLKMYLSRWRIEELFRVQKNTFEVEELQVETYAGLRQCYAFVNYLIGFYSMSIEKWSELVPLILESIRQVKPLDQIRFYLYRFINGFSEVLSYDRVGVRHFHYIEQRNDCWQLTLF